MFDTETTTPGTGRPGMEQPPAGIFPIGTRNGPWRSFAPLPAALREASISPMADQASLVRSVTGAVVAVSAAMRHLSAALEQGVEEAAVARAMAALNMAVADQSIIARLVLKRLHGTPG